MQDNSSIDKVTELLRDLGGSIGQTAEKLWPMAVEYTYYNALSNVMIASMAMILGFSTAIWSWRQSRKAKSTEDKVPWVFGAVFALAVTWLPGIIEGGNQLPALFSPEGATLHRLLNKIGG